MAHQAKNADIAIATVSIFNEVRLKKKLKLLLDNLDQALKYAIVDYVFDKKRVKQVNLSIQLNAKS